MRKSFLYILVSLSVFVSSFVSNQSMAQALDEKEKAIRLKAKQRAYLGGFEEEPLAVQQQLNTVQRKMSPVQEAPIEEHAAGQPDRED